MDGLVEAIHNHSGSRRATRDGDAGPVPVSIAVTIADLLPDLAVYKLEERLVIGAVKFTVDV